MSDRKLNREQQKLFDEHRHLAKRAARKFKGLYPRLSVSFEETEQNALIGLWRAASLFKPGSDFVPFAMQRINWHLKQAFFGRFAGNTAVVNARRFEISASEVVRSDRDESFTRLDQAEALAADAPSDLRLESRLFDIRAAIAKAPGLDSRDRRVLRLRFIYGLELEAIVERIGSSIPVVKRTIRSGVRKLRTHFAAQGSLPLDAPIPNDGNRSGCPAAVR